MLLLPINNVPAVTVATCPVRVSVPTAPPAVAVPLLLATVMLAGPVPVVSAIVTVPGLPAACDANFRTPWFNPCPEARR